MLTCDDKTNPELLRTCGWNEVGANLGQGHLLSDRISKGWNQVFQNMHAHCPKQASAKTCIYGIFSVLKTRVLDLMTIYKL